MSSCENTAFDAAARLPVLAVTGPTATGKTRLAVNLAREFSGEIVSVDSRQIYRGLDLGTGKDLEEYSAGGAPVPVHLLDIAEPTQRFDLYRYLLAAREAIAGIRSERARLPILCGGTPLYLTAIIRGYAMSGGEPDTTLRTELEQLPLDELVAMLRRFAAPELFERTDLSQSRRVIRALEIARNPASGLLSPPLSRLLILAPLYTRTEVRERILLRLDARLDAGLVDEVRRLHSECGLSFEQLDWLGLEYRFIGRYLAGTLTFDQMHEQLLNHIRQFAKRQDIWFRKMEREGLKIHWIPNGDFDQACQLVRDWLNQNIR